MLQPGERPFRLELAFLPGAHDARGSAVTLKSARDLGITLERVESRDIYLIDCLLSPDELSLITEAFVDPVVQSTDPGTAPTKSFSWAIEVGLKPGVTDNVGTSARVAIGDLLGRTLGEDEDVFASILYLLRGFISREEAELIATGLLANPLINSISIHSFDEWTSSPRDLTLPRIASHTEPVVGTHDLDRSDEELQEMSRKGLWALTVEELYAIRDHFSDEELSDVRADHGLGPAPTDVEMETLAQTWSEHCKHKIFNSTIEYVDEEEGQSLSIRSLFDSYIRGTTRKVASEVDWLLSVFTDNAGVVAFTDEVNLVFKAETHNTPSALDPYGGAMTGIVGVNRDPFGTGRGADLLINTWGYCFASPFHDGDIPAGLMHPRRIRDGVHQGVIDGGNQSGIPYGRGWELFDERYLGKPLVYCGTVGIMPTTLSDGAVSHEKIIETGDVIVMVGGRIGADGIHGATFSSQELHEESPSQAVQIGDPITQKKMTDFLLEALDRGLYTSITDNGAGGLSSSVGEMAQATGGATIDLTKAKVKYPGLMPWEILLSEAQERMTVGIPPDLLDGFLELAARREVEATPLGTFTDSGFFHVLHGEQTVALIEMGFLHNGWPEPQLNARWNAPTSRPLPEHDLVPDLALRGLLARENIASKEEKSRQYDHEVKARTIVKPFVGVSADVPADATVFLVDLERPEGVVLAEGINPWYSDLDTRHMAMAVVDEAVRRLIAGGAKPGTISALDNFCWPDPVESTATPDGRYKLAQLVRTCQGLHDSCVAYGVPLISGKDSMKNDSTRGGVKISIPPTLLVSAMGRIDDVALSQTPEPKAAGDILYIVGETAPELGASEFARWIESRDGSRPEGTLDGAVGGSPPVTEPQRMRIRYERMSRAIADGIPASVKTPSLGGLAVALAWMSFGAELGLRVDLGSQPVSGEVDLWERLFSESTGRFIVTVPPDQTARFEEALAGEPVARAGTVEDAPRLVITLGGETLIDSDIMELKDIWKAPLAGF
ncbi:AIR synthase-related protein [Gemmatimonadota bacterium]